MTENIFNSEFNLADQADKSVRSYTPSAQELAQETPTPVDNSPITDAEREALFKATNPGVDTAFTNQVDRDRAPTFQHGEWEHPAVRERRRRAHSMPSVHSLDDLDQRVNSVLRFKGVPTEVTDLAEDARAVVSAARELLEASRHPENRRQAISIAAKDAVVTEIARATASVAELEALSGREDIRALWFDSLTAGIEKQKDAALEALRAAEETYSALRSSINAAQALAVEAGMWYKGWHSSVTSEIELNAPIASMRSAIGFLESDNDHDTGLFLTAAYPEDQIPPHSLEKLKQGADLAGGGSYLAQIYARAKSPMTHDQAAVDAIAQKSLSILTNSNPLTTDLLAKPEHN